MAPQEGECFVPERSSPSTPMEQAIRICITLLAAAADSGHLVHWLRQAIRYMGQRVPAAVRAMERYSSSTRMAPASKSYITLQLSPPPITPTVMESTRTVWFFPALDCM